MPELPEAQTIATQLDRCLRGVRLGKVNLRLRKILRGNPGTLRNALPGRTVTAVARRGKRIVVSLYPEATLVIGLGMTGQLMVADVDAPRDRHVHLRISLDGNATASRELRFRDVRRFGSVWLTQGRTDAPPAGLADLGPEPLEITAREFDHVLSRRRQIKALLMDQQTIAGMGNIYCDESLYAAGIHPLTCAADLDQPKRRALLRAIRRILRQAIRHGGSTLRDYVDADGTEGQFQTLHRVYGRTDEPCRKCGTPIERIIAAGRSTHLCPACQPSPRGAARLTEPRP